MSNYSKKVHKLILSGTIYLIVRKIRVIELCSIIFDIEPQILLAQDSKAKSQINLSCGNRRIATVPCDRTLIKYAKVKAL